MKPMMPAGTPPMGMPDMGAATETAPTDGGNVTCPMCGTSVTTTAIDGKSVPLSVGADGSVSFGGAPAPVEEPIAPPPSAGPSETDLISKNLGA
jgi:hypothetical protein